MSITTPVAAPRAFELLCENISEPLGLEVVRPRLSWKVENLGRQAGYQILSASSIALLKNGQADLWDSGRVESAQNLLVEYGGSPLRSRQRVYWTVRVWDASGRESENAESSWWEMGLLRGSDWSGQWIGFGAILNNHEARALPAPLLRKEFGLNETPIAARLYISGLGYFEAFLNGKRIGDHVLDPIVRQYDKHVGYVVLDVSEMVQPRANCLGAMLGNGWYNTHTTEVWHFDKLMWRDYPKLLCQLELTFADGRTERVKSDSSWKVGEGALRFDQLRNGELYDARLQARGWKEAGFDDSGWKNVAVVAGPPGELIAQLAPPCRVVETLSCPVWTELEDGAYLADFRANITGWGRLNVEGPAGTEVTMRYAEMVTESGDLDPSNINIFIKSGDTQTDRYILRGEGRERFEPGFTYHGFQYARVEGLPSAPGPNTLEARIVQSDLASAGSFRCSNETLNTLQKLTRRSYISNFTGIPTDCPHREKNGWTGDAQLACETGLFNFDANVAYQHWLDILADTQRLSGQLPGIAPTGGWGFNWGNGPAWDSALIVIPWNIYLYRGDAGPLWRYYEGMKRYVNFAVSMLDDGVLKYGLGDWCPPEGVTRSPSELATTAILFDDALLLSKMAQVLGKPEDRSDYLELAAHLREGWRRAFLKEEGKIGEDTQTCIGCALYYDLLEPEERPAAVERLKGAVEAANGRPTFGILGAKWVPRALSQAGLDDMAYEMVAGEGFPGWAHWLEMGATSLWENWNGEASRNHIMFGDISAWMFKYLAGISPVESEPGFRRFLIAPRPVAGLDWVEAEHVSPYGVIKSAWRRENGGITLEVTVPGNTVAEVRAPEGMKVVGETELAEGRHRVVFAR